MAFQICHLRHRNEMKWMKQRERTLAVLENRKSVRHDQHRSHTHANKQQRPRTTTMAKSYWPKWWKSIKIDSHHWQIIHRSVAWMAFSSFEFLFLVPRSVSIVLLLLVFLQFHNENSMLLLLLFFFFVKMDRPKCYQINASACCAFAVWIKAASRSCEWNNP